MAALRWLKQYSGQTVEELLSLEEEYRLDSLVLAFEQAIEQKVSREGSQETSVERVVRAVEALEREVNNGGYLQFFVNSSVEFAPDIVASLRQINCPKTAEITQRAIDALGLPKLTVAAICSQMEAADETRDKELSKCDDAYYSGLSGECIEESLLLSLSPTAPPLDCSFQLTTDSTMESKPGS